MDPRAPMFREETYNPFDGALEQASAGFVMDEATFRAFYDRTARGLWAYLARVTGDRALADDLLQETFYRFLRAEATYESESHCRNSLFRIATNLARDARRRSLIRGVPSVAGDEIERLPAAVDSAAADRSRDVNRALARLKPRERAMLWLAYAEGASHTEIAGMLGLRPSSLKPLLFRARKKLAGLLGHALKRSES
jgi:RNA polymerase sigma-70 factor, ECF subfamily